MIERGFEMYQNILKKDLKRKKTMNLILLLFVIMATTFISSSVNNLITISAALDGYLERAGVGDFLIGAKEEVKNDKEIKKILKESEEVEEWELDVALNVDHKNIEFHSENSDKDAIGMVLINCFKIKQQKFFDNNNQVIDQVEDGTLYIPNSTMEKGNLKIGDIISIKYGNETMKFTLIGNCKDAILGSPMMGRERFVVSENDYKKLTAFSQLERLNVYSVVTDNLAKVENEFSKTGCNIAFSISKDVIKTSYIMDMVTAGVLLIVSTCLIIFSLVILRFTINFTLNEEFREIGIMKAIGIKARSIRKLYIAKYFAISFIGASIGFCFSLPFGNMFLKKVSKNIAIFNEEGGTYINLLCSVMVITIVLWFCYLCTRKINKITPVDAIRNGSNGERYKRKGWIRLRNSKKSVIWFMAWNDILMDIKRFSILILVFTIGIILILVPVNAMNTLKSDKIVTWLSMAESDLHISDENIGDVVKEGRKGLLKYLKDTEGELEKRGIEASVFCEILFKYKIELGEYSCMSLAFQGNGVTADQYVYTKGQAPKYTNEVAITHIIANKLHAQIGDTVVIKTGNKESEYIIAAIYQSMYSMGEGIRFSEKEDLDYKDFVESHMLQVTYTDNPDKIEKERRYDILKGLYPESKIYTGGEYVNEMTGNLAGQIDGIKQFIVVVVLILNMLVVVLMMKTFIAREKSEIGMLKAIGFKNTVLIKWQILRIGILLMVSIILGVIVSGPISQISAGKLFEMAGASRIEFEVKIMEVYVIYPMAIFITTIMAGMITAFGVKRILASETNHIE